MLGCFLTPHHTAHLDKLHVGGVGEILQRRLTLLDDGEVGRGTAQHSPQVTAAANAATTVQQAEQAHTLPFLGKNKNQEARLEFGVIFVNDSKKYSTHFTLVKPIYRLIHLKGPFPFFILEDPYGFDTDSDPDP